MKLSMMEGSLDGNTWIYLPDRKAVYMSKSSNGYHVGDFAFYTAYHMWFSSR